MTPAIHTLRKAGIGHTVARYKHDPDHPSYGLEAAEKLGVDATRVFKTLVVATDNGHLAVAVVPASARLSLRALAQVLGVRSATLAEPAAVQRATGYVLGGISPFGQRRRLATVVDESAFEHATIHVSGGRRGLEIEVAPDALLALLDATAAHLTR